MTDKRVASAIANWGPRFTTNGVAVADFERITREVRDWADWCAAWSAAGAGHEALGVEARKEGRLLSAGQHFAQAAVYHHFGKFLFVQDPDQMRAAHAAAVRCLDAALPHLRPPGRRVAIPSPSGRFVGVLRLPAQDQYGAGPHPAIVLIPGLDSAKEEFRSTEALFLERGVATFSVDGPGQGESEYDTAIRGDWEEPGAAILDALAAQPGVDPERMGVWGVSLGGYYAPRIASADPRVRACVALAGPYDFGECWDRLPPLTREAFRVRSRSADDAAARRVAHTLSLDGRAERISCPLLVITGKRDRLIPWLHGVRLARTAGRRWSAGGGGQGRASPQGRSGGNQAESDRAPEEHAGVISGWSRRSAVEAAEDEAPAGTLLLLEEGNHGCMNVAAQHRQRTADWVAQRLGGNRPERG